MQLYHVELCNGEAVCSLCSYIMLSFVMGRQCVLCEIGYELLQLKPTKKHFYYNLILQNFLYMFRSKKVHHQEFSCRTQAFWYNSLTIDLDVEDFCKIIF